MVLYFNVSFCCRVEFSSLTFTLRMRNLFHKMFNTTIAYFKVLTKVIFKQDLKLLAYKRFDNRQIFIRMRRLCALNRFCVIISLLFYHQK